MKRKSKRIKSKVRLERLEDGEWRYVECGSIWPNPITVGESVHVGSISSRTIWATTPVTEIVSDEGKEILFNTRNSQYKVVL